MQSGGPTAVLNRSLAGVVEEALRHREIGEIYGAVHGLEGLAKGRFLDLRRRSKAAWRRVAQTPGAALGTARRKLGPGEAPAVLDILREHGIAHIFSIGGNDSADTAHRLAAEARARGQALTVVSVPKTVDNDLPETDHCPGYGSAARFIALATMGSGMDAESMGQASPITILEVMGRNAGWMVAASALGKREERDPPHIVCPPEAVFDEDRFTARIEEAYARWGYAVAVVSENLTHSGGRVGHEGEALYVDVFGHKYYQSPSQYLAARLSHRLGVRVRHEKPGTIQRSLVPCTSKVDATEAHMAGQAAVSAALAGGNDVMVTLVREAGLAYSCTTGLAPLEAVAGAERRLPADFFDEAAGLPTQAFVEYARPLIGGPLPRFERLR